MSLDLHNHILVHDTVPPSAHSTTPANLCDAGAIWCPLCVGYFVAKPVIAAALIEEVAERVAQVVEPTLVEQLRPKVAEFLAHGHDDAPILRRLEMIDQAQAERSAAAVRQADAARLAQRIESIEDTYRHFVQYFGEKSPRRASKETRRELHETNLVDLLSNLAHYCDRYGFSLEDLLTQASQHYDAETNGEGIEFDFLPYDLPDDAPLPPDAEEPLTLEAAVEHARQQAQFAAQVGQAFLSIAGDAPVEVVVSNEGFAADRRRCAHCYHGRAHSALAHAASLASYDLMVDRRVEEARLREADRG
jgi:hypothetical protein